MSDTVRLDEIRSGLLGADSRRERRLELLKILVDEHPAAEALPILRDAARCDRNQDLIEAFIRSYERLGDASAIPDVLPYLGHPEGRIVVGAARSLAGLDRRGAVQHLRTLVLVGDERAFLLADVLAERCLAESEALFLSLAFAARSRHRMLALCYLRRLASAEAVPLVLEMIRRERRNRVRVFLMRLLALKATVEDYERIQKLREELAVKLHEIDVTLKGLRPAPSSDEISIEEISCHGMALDPMASDGADASEIEIDPPRLASMGADVDASARYQVAPHLASPVPGGAVVEGGPVVPAAPPPPLPPLAGIPKGPSAGGTPDSRPPSEAPPSAKSSGTPAGPSAPRSKLPLVPVVLLGLAFSTMMSCAMLMVRGVGSDSPARTEPGMTPLGRLGATIRYTGTIVEIRSDPRFLRIRQTPQMELWVTFETVDVTRFDVGDLVTITGILRNVEGGSVYYIDGDTAERAIAGQS